MKPGTRWEDLETFLKVAQEGSFRKTAGIQKVSVNTVRARVERLEAIEGTRLVERAMDGVRLTSAGRNLVAVATRTRTAAMGRDAEEATPFIIAGELRIGSSEAIGSVILTPRMLELQAQLPELTINLQCDYDIARDRSADLDVSVTFARPTNPNIVYAKLATVHFMAFASRSYIAANGVPQSLDDLKRHRFIEQAAPGVRSDFLDLYVGEERPPGFLPIRTNSSFALFWAVVNGAGIAVIPTYSVTVSNKVVPLDIPIQLRREIFYTYRAELRGSREITTTIAWLKQVFDSRANPWFADDFVHPAAFAGDQEDNVVRLFGSMVDVDPLRVPKKT